MLEASGQSSGLFVPGGTGTRRVQDGNLPARALPRPLRIRGRSAGCRCTPRAEDRGPGTGHERPRPLSTSCHQVPGGRKTAPPRAPGPWLWSTRIPPTNECSDPSGRVGCEDWKPDVRTGFQWVVVTRIRTGLTCGSGSWRLNRPGDRPEQLRRGRHERRVMGSAVRSNGPPPAPPRSPL